MKLKCPMCKSKRIEECKNSYYRKEYICVDCSVQWAIINGKEVLIV